MEIVTHSTKQLADLILSGRASEQELAAAKPEDVFAIKTDSSVRHFRTAAADATANGDRAFRFVASDETTDRMGDIIRVAGWDFKDFKKNPVALWAHDDRQPPIGRVTTFEKVLEGTPKLFETIQYAGPDVNPYADVIYRLVDNGFVKAVSVGFLPIKTNYPASPEERIAAGLGPYGVEYLKQSQLELSNCSVPANPAALVAGLRSLTESGKLAESLAKDFARRLELPIFERAVVAFDSTKTDPAQTTGTTSETVPVQRTVDASEPKPDEIAALRAEMKALRDELAQTRSELKSAREDIGVITRAVCADDAHESLKPASADTVASVAEQKAKDDPFAAYAAAFDELCGELALTT